MANIKIGEIYMPQYMMQAQAPLRQAPFTLILMAALRDQSISGALAMKVRRATRVIEPEREAAEEEVNKIIIKYGTQDKKSGGVTVSNKNFAEFNREIMDLLDSTFECEKIPYADLEHFTLPTPAWASALIDYPDEPEAATGEAPEGEAAQGK